jgi:MarR family 2-MHQ and catechol resistance regulon transcriptional repressor
MNNKTMPKEYPLDGDAFTDVQQKIRANLLLTVGLMKNHLNDLFKPFGVTWTQYNVLQILEKQDGVPLSTLHLRDKMLDKMSDTPKIVERLVKKGLVHKKASLKDRRLVEVTLSAKGLILFQELREKEKVHNTWFGVLSESDITTLNQLLTVLRCQVVDK